MKLVQAALIGLLRVSYFLPVVVLVSFLALIFGHPILGSGFPGSDNANFVAMANWLGQWFPRVPFWFPQEGAGMSFIISYPILNHLLIVILQKLSGLPIAVVFRLWSLAALVLTSVGIYLLGFRLTKNQTVSALAAIFYPLCPITWVFLLEWGFAADQLSYLFIPPLFIFAVLFMDEYYQKGLNLKTRIYFLSFIGLFALLPLAHPNIFAGVLLYLSVLLVIYPFLNFKSKALNFKKVFLLTGTSLLLVFLLSFFWFLPYFRYQSIAGQGGPVEKELPHYGLTMQYAVHFKNLFNLTTKTAAYKTVDDPVIFLSPWSWRNIAFPLAISTMALIGLIGSFFLNRKVFALGLANLVPIIIAVSAHSTFPLLKIARFMWFFLNWRAAIVSSRIIIPLLAGFGCYVLAYLFTFPLDLFTKKLKSGFFKSLGRLTFIIFSALGSLSIAAFTLWQFRHWPDNSTFKISYGPEIAVNGWKFDVRDIWSKETDLCFNEDARKLEDVDLLCRNQSLQRYFWVDKLFRACSLLKEKPITLPSEINQICQAEADEAILKLVAAKCFSGGDEPGYQEICSARVESLREQISKVDNWRQFYVTKDLFGEGKEIFSSEREIFELLPSNQNTRLDISGSLGRLMMIAPFYSQMPELPVYYNQGTLIKNFWNYEISAYNEPDGVWAKETILAELAKYFGLEYLLLYNDLAPLNKYQAAGWEPVKVYEKVAGRLALWRFSQPQGLLQATTRPTVLVIGQDKFDGYFRIFHLANLGALPYEKALLVKGKPNPDAYSVEELKKFDAVILEGYSYKNQKRGWKVLDEYVKSGGSLLINTGWQYSSADWQLKSTPNFFPLEKHDWITTQGPFDYQWGEGSEVGGKVDLTKFSPLIYDGKGWDISSAPKTSLRDWAKIVISAGDRPLVAGGKYGQGKVIWLGLDLPGHIGAYEDNEEEVAFYKNLVDYLLEDKTGKELKAGFERAYPDKLEITINESTDQKVAIYFSEAYYPDFMARLVEEGKSKKMTVYKAGPGMTMFILPRVTAGSKIIYEYQTPLAITMARVISFFSLSILIIFIVRPQILSQAEKYFSGWDWKAKFKKGILGGGGDEDLNY